MTILAVNQDQGCRFGTVSRQNSDHFVFNSRNNIQAISAKPPTFFMVWERWSYQRPLASYDCRNCPGHLDKFAQGIQQPNSIPKTVRLLDWDFYFPPSIVKCSFSRPIVFTDSSSSVFDRRRCSLQPSGGEEGTWYYQIIHFKTNIGAKDYQTRRACNLHVQGHFCSGLALKS